MTSPNTGIIHSNAHINKDELLAKIGGKATLHKAVDEFYDRLMNEKELQPLFKHANMNVLKWHQFNIMSIAFTQVPENIDIQRLILTQHASLFDYGLTARHYDIVCRHFTETLRDLKVDPAAIEQAKSVVFPLRAIFAQGAAAPAKRNDAQRRKRTIALALMASLAVLGAIRFLRSRRR